MLKKNKISFFMNEWDSDLEYEEGDCFDLDDECKPIPKVLKKQFCDKTRIAKYLLFSTDIFVLNGKSMSKASKLFGNFILNNLLNDL